MCALKQNLIYTWMQFKNEIFREMTNNKIAILNAKELNEKEKKNSLM